ncbi:hypothetical protein [Deinococcus sp. 12RED42]|uniref:hypothetical protein n=1 Tax=Deinococcus sp. 12RED42 TaxID=2745872 RepID=UPI001E372036|nr:hypothetical protein [Deinococcus sp. 12RED42]MCD0165264.1 hypothetical protein [Deinococcus sp. 12RED42]
MNHDLDQYVVRIDQPKFPLLRALVQGGQLQQVLTSVPGWPRANVYQPLPQVTAGGDNLLRLGLIQLTAQLYALPSAAYEAILRSSSEYWQPAGLAELRTLFDTPGVNADVFRASLKATLARPLVQDHTPHLAAKDHGCHADWRPDRTLILEQDGRWLLVLAFHLRSRVPWASERHVYGIDLNDDPILCVVDAARNVQMVGARHSLLDALRHDHAAQVPGAQLSPEEIRLVSTLGYAAGRAPLEVALRGLLGQARAVGVERLDLRGRQARFVARSREQAALDWHTAWLPQALYRAGIELHRLDPVCPTRERHRHLTRLGTVQGRTPHGPPCEQSHRAFDILKRTLQLRHLKARK